MTAPEKDPNAVCSACGADMDAESLACFHCGHARRSAPLMKGQVISGRYELTNLLGRGGMGTVYEAHDRSLDERVALKVLSEAARNSGDADRRFRDEIKLARKIRHPNVCGIHEYGKDGDLQYIVMEFIDGLDLKKYVRAKGRLATEEALGLARQIGEGLQAIHDAGVVHRDLKLANVMRDVHGQLRLMDFGIAKAMGDTTATATGHIIGTPEYMSPEQVQGLRVDPRSDLYSLAVMTYELLTGRVPFKADTPLATIMLQVHEAPQLEEPTIPLPLVPILARALAKNPAERYASVRAFLADLAAAPVSSVPQSAAPVQPTPPPRYAPTLDVPTPIPAARPRTMERPRPKAPIPPAPAPAPIPSPQASERRFSLWLGALGAALVGLGLAIWLVVKAVDLVRSQPDAEPAPPASETQRQAAAVPSISPELVVATPSPLPAAPAEAPSPEDRIPARHASAVEPRPASRNPPGRGEAPATRSAPASRPNVILPLPDPTLAPPVAPATRTPLPSAGLTALPEPSPPAAATSPPAPARSPAPPPEAAPPPAKGTLQLGAKPYASVLIDGKDAGTLPLAPLQLPEGRHVVRFLHPGYQPLQRTVTIRAGETVKLFVDWSLDGIAR